MALRTRATRITRSGVFVRNDQGFGLLAYSPYTGLSYAIHPSDVEAVLKWLEAPRSKPPSDQYKLSLGASWAISIEEVNIRYLIFSPIVGLGPT